MIQNLNDEKLFKLVEEYFGGTHYAVGDMVLHNETGHCHSAYLYRAFAQEVIDMALGDLALDAERLDWLIGQGCHHGVVYEGLDKSFWMVWLDGHDAHKDEHQIGRHHTAREAIDSAIEATTRRNNNGNK